MTSTLLQQLTQPSIQQYIRDHEHDDVRKLVLKGTLIDGVKSSEIASQIVGRQKTKFKVPRYFNTQGIIFPPALNLEQSSSEATAIWKSSLMNNAHVVDLTGGFGIDSFFISKVAQQVTYVEPNADLLIITRHNHQLLGATNIDHVSDTAEHFLSRPSTFDIAYIDPSRRNENQKVFKLGDCMPDVVTLQPAIFQHCKKLIVKASPLLDVKAGLHEMKSVRKVIVLAVDNECKEVLLVSEAGFQGEPTIRAVNLSKHGDALFDFSFADEEGAQSVVAEPAAYLYEPNAAILKVGAFKTVGERYKLKKLHTNTHLYTSNDFVDEFPGRVFKIEAIIKPEAHTVAPFFPDGKANVTTRNYPVRPEELKKKLKLGDGGDRYLIAFTGPTQKYVVVASRIK